MRRQHVPRLILAILVVACSAELLVTDSSSDERNRIPHQNWVTAATRFVRPEGVELVVRAGDHERSIYRLHRGSIGKIGVSRDGQRVAFARSLSRQSDPLFAVCVIDSDGSNLRSVFELSDVVGEIAWTADNRNLAFIGASSSSEYDLIIIDISAADVRTVIRDPVGRGRFMRLTSQAWAPDGKRIVYTSADGRILTMDTTTMQKEVLGYGSDPTWSPDGTLISYRQDTKGSPPGDYVTVTMLPPSRLKRILRNTTSIGDVARGRGFFIGPALWSPDGRFLALSRLEGNSEVPRPYVLEVSTGTLTPLPIGSLGDLRSLGGAATNAPDPPSPSRSGDRSPAAWRHPRSTSSAE